MRLILGMVLLSLSLGCAAQKLRLLATEYPPYTSPAMPTQGAMIEVVQKNLSAALSIGNCFCAVGAGAE
ncbi:hypothetical protein [Deefgea sp. CFH1-16]|uniref:hypothetical protein n=1 Tax=Deefgea sp. CFH1-16 TaxID=2675457 RepID=UPI0015F4672F|nr:hypothetical protein [Deefgea sp. CFH1-16]MBM5574354.1 hypothetical protein [Deefgea sp. CFH1-16]